VIAAGAADHMAHYGDSGPSWPTQGGHPTAGDKLGWLVGKFVNRIISVWEDDPFNAKTLELIIPSATAPFNQPSLVFHFTRRGEYAVRYRWTVS
jgi:hypothetical protein